MTGRKVQTNSRRVLLI